MKTILLIRRIKKITTKAVNTSRSYSQLSYIHNIGKTPFRSVPLGKILEEIAIKHGGREAIVSHEQKKLLCFDEVLENADKVAAGLKNLGIQKGDRVALWAPNLIEWYITYMACARGGYSLVTLNPAYQGEEIKYCLNKVGAKILICAEGFKKQKYYDILQQIHPEISENNNKFDISCASIPSLKNIVMISNNTFNGTIKYEELVKNASDKEIKEIKNSQHLVNPESILLVQFTSGTTGKPKASLASHFNVVNNSFQVGKRLEMDKKYHRICLQSPLFHALGLIISASMALHMAATEVISGSTYNPLNALKTCSEEGCTVIHGTPTMYVDLVNLQEKHKFKLNLEKAVVGGAPCSPELFRQIQNILGIKEVQSVYGLTESTAVVFQSFPEDTKDEYKLTETVGCIGDHIEAKLVDEHDNIVPIGTPGELCLRGYVVTQGYWDDEVKTKELIGKDGWLRTGDKFILQKDGYGKIVGRIKDMIIRGGENIFPKEIEDFINTHPDVIESQVIGIPDKRLGEEVCVCIRIKENKNLTQEDIKRFSNGKLADFKIPKYVKILPEFPRTASGKVQKFKLRELVLNMT